MWIPPVEPGGKDVHKIIHTIISLFGAAVNDPDSTFWNFLRLFFDRPERRERLWGEMYKKRVFMK